MMTSTKKYYADVRIEYTIEFDDDMDLCLQDQAHEKAIASFGNISMWDADISIVGKVREGK